MKKKKMINQKAKKADISITLLVFLTLALCIASLIVFMSYEKKLNSRLSIIQEINNFYIESQNLEIYFKSLLVSSSKEVITANPLDRGLIDLNPSYSEELALKIKIKFLENFYKDIPQEYSSENIKSQLTSENIQITIEKTNQDILILLHIPEFKFIKVIGPGIDQEIDVIKYTKNILLSIIV